MYLHFCPAYEQLEVAVEGVQEHINLSLRSVKTGSTISVTLSGPQVAIVATALLENLSAVGEVDDPLNIFGGAVRIGGNPMIEKRKEAA